MESRRISIALAGLVGLEMAYQVDIATCRESLLGEYGLLGGEFPGRGFLRSGLVRGWLLR